MKKKVLSLLLSLTMLTSALPAAVPAFAAESKETAVGTTYYVSTLNGNDNNSGTAQDQAFYSLQKINEITLQPGDKVLLESGSIFTNGYLHIKGSGTAEAPIVIDKYGEGNDPVIATNGQGVWYQDYGKSLDSSSHRYKGYVSSSILLYDVEYVEVSNLELTNDDVFYNVNYSDVDKLNRTGVAVVAQNKGTIDHVYLKNLNVHDVDGNVYDKHMNNGGIYFTVFQPKDEAATGISRYNDVLIEGCEVNTTSRWGIAVGYTAYWNQFTASEISDSVSETYGSTNVVIRNNYVKDSGGDAITTMYCDRPLIEYNVSDGAAREINPEIYSQTSAGRVAAGIWPWKCKDAVFQYNEAFDTCQNQDGQAWDADWGDGTIYQYNYSHNNGGGSVMICGAQAINTIFRYNISQNDLSGVLNIPGNPVAHIYNNVFYMKEGVPFIRDSMTGGTAVVENNIIYNAGSEKSENWSKNSRVTYSNNLYYNYNNTPADDTAAVTADPKFVSAGSAPSSTAGVVSERSAFDGYKLQEDSPAINAGKVIENNGGRDFFGNEVTGIPDIGAYESQVPSLVITSSVYRINQETKEIRGLEKDTTVAQFLANLSYDQNCTVQVLTSDDQVLSEDDVVSGGMKVKTSYGSTELIYTIVANNDVSIHDSYYMIKDHTIYYPGAVTAAEVKSSILTHSTTGIVILNGEVEVGDDTLVNDDMTLKIVAEDGTQAVYALESKTTFHYSEDFQPGVQGYTWYAQHKVGDEFVNLTTYNDSWGCWTGSGYDFVGLSTKGSGMGAICGLTDKVAMAWKAPKDGVISFSLTDLLSYRNASNSTSTSDIQITKNGQVVAPASGHYSIHQNKTAENDGKLILEPVEINVKKGDIIRFETKDAAGSVNTSYYVTPVIRYLDKEVADDSRFLNNTATASATSGTAEHVLNSNLGGTFEWVASSGENESVTLTWEALQQISRVSLFDTSSTANQVLSGKVIAVLEDGTEVEKTFGELANDGVTATVVAFDTPVKTREIRVEITDATGVAGLAAANVYGKEASAEVNKDALGKAIEEAYAEANKTGVYTEESIALYREEISKAEAVIHDAEATQEEVDAAVAALEAAEDLLVVIPQPGNKSELGKIIQEAFSYDLSKYVDDVNKTAFLETLEAANNLYETDDTATQAEIDAMASNLLSAVDKLRLRADKTNLLYWLEQLENIDLSRYTAQSAQVLASAIAQAKALSAQDLGEESNALIQAAVENLIAAQEALEPLDKNPGGSSSGSEEPGTSSEKDSIEVSSKEQEPSSSEQPAEDSASGKETEQKPATGDSAPLGATALLAAAATGALLVLKKRKTN